MTRVSLGIGAVVLVAAVTASYFWWRSATAPAPSAPAPEVAAAPQPAPAPSAAMPAVRYPIEAPVGASAAQAEAAAAASAPAVSFKTALDALLGRAAVLQWLQLDDFARRLVATVDNLPREHAAAQLWPFNPTPGRFSPTETPQGAVIGSTNHARYAAFVDWVHGVDSRRAVAVYRSLYPLFQRAYEDLGFPGRHFNDRLVDVIDHLLATPEPAAPLAVHLLEVKGNVPSLRPWVRFEFSDPELQARSAGQKLLLRVGLANEQRLKAKLAEIRSLITQPASGGG